ncbi:Integrase core domain protein [Thalassoglobus neptunius]|uniref:Integrase core domain protein n=2 Tax=Thalassoglobus neptunius TaxID=1938619 RepID=A0A5C5X566_9PLAN|nr:Integrase core domain protein [Thalassoglobus neptunius]
MTLDNGKEFAQHRQVSRHCGIDIYFARLYHAWERGRNESFNGLLRQFFPKGTDFARLSTNTLNDVTNLLNNRSRKRLNDQTSKEVLQDHLTVAIEL